MDLSRFKKVLAGISVAAISLTQVSAVLAAYSDVAAGVWYEDAVQSFMDDGILDASQPRFRGGENAARSEFVKLLVMLNGGLLSTPPAVASFDDVKSGAWYYAYMEEAAKEGWVRGDGNCYGSHPCYARPGANINRAEAASLIVRAFGLEATGAAPQFVDNPSGQWYTDAIQTAADHCVLQGDDSTGRVRPSDNMNRAEMVVMLHRVDQGLSYGADCGGDDMADAGISGARALSSSKVEVSFTAPLDKATAEMASKYSVSGATPAVTVVSAKLVSDDTVELTLSGDLAGGNDYTVTVSDMETTDGTVFSDSDSFAGYTSLPTSNSTLSVVLSSKNPVGDTVPRGAVGVTMASMDITASCDDSASITDVTILHEGFGVESDIDGVYVAVNGARMSRKRTIDSKDQTASVHLSDPLDIAACKTVTVDIVADFASTASTASEHNLAVELPSDVTTNAKQVTGNFPLRGSTFKVAAVTSGNVSIEYRTVSPSEVEVGDKSVVVGKFQVSTDSTEDQTIYSMTVEQNGTGHDGDIQNLKIRRSDGTVLTNTVATTVGDFATFVFDPPFTVLEGDKMTLEVIGDVSGGAGDNVKMHFEETSDVFAVGSLYGYGVNGQLYGSRVTLSTATTPATVTIDAGEFTIEIDGPKQQSYTRDQNEAVLANVIFTTGGERIDVRKLFVAIQGNVASGSTLNEHATSVTTGSTDEISEVLENVTLRNKSTGRGVDGVRLTTSGTSGQSTSGLIGSFQIYRFDDFSVNGKETYEFRVDFKDNGTGNHPKGGDLFKIHICGEPTEVSTSSTTAACTFGGLLATASTAYQMEVEGISTGDSVNDIRPRGNIAGSAMRIADSTLTVAVKATGTLDTAVKNSKNINLMRFEARAGEAKDLLLTKLIFASQSGSLNNGQNYTLWVDTDGDSKVDTILEKGVTSQASKITFSQLTGGGFVIPKEKTVVMEVHSDITASLTNDDLQIRFSTADTYIEAETVDRGTSLSGISTNGTISGGGSTADIVVTTVDTQRWFLISQGDLYVSKDTTPVRNRQLLGGATADTILRLNFHAENEDIDVTDIQLTSSGSMARSVDRLDLYKEGATTAFGSATVGSCGPDDVLNMLNGASVQTFCVEMQSRQLVIPKGSDVKVLVKPVIKTDVDGATSGTGVQIVISGQAVSNNSTGSGAIRARGDQSSNNLSANSGDGVANGEVFIGKTSANSGGNSNADIVGNTNVTVLSKIQTISNANPDANGTNVPTGVADLGQFKISAAPNSNSKNGLNKVVLSGVVFNVNATNVAIDSSSLKFYNKANSTVTRSCTPYNTTLSSAIVGSASGSFVVLCDAFTDANRSSVNTTIDQGTDQTFVLQANVTNPKISNSSTSTLQVSIVNFDSKALTAFGISSTQSHFAWLDQDGGSVSTNGTTTSSVFRWVEYPDTTVKSTSYQG